MRTLKKKVLGKRASDQEKKFWALMRSADSGSLCFS